MFLLPFVIAISFVSHITYIYFLCSIMMFIYRRAPDWSEEKNCFFVVRLGFLAFGSIFFCHIKFRDTELRNEKKKKENCQKRGRKVMTIFSFNLVAM